MHYTQQNSSYSYQKPEVGKSILGSGISFTPATWSQLLMARDFGNHEIGFMGITTDTERLNLVTELVMPLQEVGVAHCDFDDEGMAQMMDQMIQRGLQPYQFMRVWIHTHPGSSATPSSTDEKTFADTFGMTDYAIMVIVAKGGQTYARLKVTTPFPVSVEIPVTINWSVPFSGSDFDAWKAIVEENVVEKSYSSYNGQTSYAYGPCSYRGVILTSWEGGSNWCGRCRGYHKPPVAQYLETKKSKKERKKERKQQQQLQNQQRLIGFHTGFAGLDKDEEDLYDAYDSYVPPVSGGVDADLLEDDDTDVVVEEFDENLPVIVVYPEGWTEEDILVYSGRSNQSDEDPESWEDRII